MMANDIIDLHSNLEFRRKLDNIALSEEQWGILIMGLDGFKRINNLYSYSFGDKVLERFAAQVSAMLPRAADLYKLDGDCFGILQQDVSVIELQAYFESAQYIVQNGLLVEETPISLAISGGICFCPTNGQDGETLYKNARIALIESKEQGGNRSTILSAELLNKVQFSMNLLESVKQSVQNNFEGFFLHYQPLVLTQSGELYGCEVLLRWRHEVFPGGVSPYEFIPILENYGMIIDVGNWVLENAIKQLAVWTESMPDFQMSINVSTIQFENPYFKLFVIDTLHKYGVNPNLVTLELTESGQITNVKYVSEIFNFLRSQGIKIAFDDFGTGYASLEIFRVLSADELKIDRSFLDRISYDVTDQKIVSQLIQLCDSMNMFVCVEGIETKEIEAIAKQLNPKLLQGYYYSVPLSAQDFYDRYFTGEGPSISAREKDDGQQDMVYSEYRPAQPMTMEEIVDNVYAGVFQVAIDREFTFLTCNEGYRRMLGYTATEIDQKFHNRALGFVHPDDVAYVNEEIGRQLGLGDTVTIEFRVVRSDGVPIWILGTGNVVKGKNGSSSLIIVIIDNDVFKRESLRIAQEHALHGELLSRIPTGIKYLRFDKDFTIEYISDGFLSLLGYTRTEIQTLFDGKYINLIYEEDREKVINDVLEQLKISNMVVLHYRSPCKDGSLIWLETVSSLYPADADGVQRCCSSVVNVTETITEQKKQRAISLATRYQQAATLWGDIVFEYNFESQKFTLSNNYETIFGRGAFETLDDAICITHRDDRDLLLQILEDIREKRNQAAVSVELRLMQGNGEYAWCSFHCNQADMIGGVPISVVGKLYKIDTELQKQQDILKKMEIDALTGLLNKSTIEQYAVKRMRDDGTDDQFALFTIDIDQFKSINQAYGHMAGDDVLQILAKRLQSIFKGKDLVARTGGDEFMVLTSFPDGCQFIKNKCEKILRTLEDPVKLGDHMLQLNICVGVSITKGHQMKFYDLYQQANMALYRAKEMGKGQYCII